MSDFPNWGFYANREKYPGLVATPPLVRKNSPCVAKVPLYDVIIFLGIIIKMMFVVLLFLPWFIISLGIKYFKQVSNLGAPFVIFNLCLLELLHNLLHLGDLFGVFLWGGGNLLAQVDFFPLPYAAQASLPLILRWCGYTFLACFLLRSTISICLSCPTTTCRYPY